MILTCLVFPSSENNISNVIDTTFSVENNSFGAVKVHELKNQGANITVTEDNKKEYVKLYVNYRFMRGIEQQFLALQKGFTELIPSMLLRPFDEREIELLICGISNIDVADWKTHTRLKHCAPDTTQVAWFWQVSEERMDRREDHWINYLYLSSFADCRIVYPGDACSSPAIRDWVIARSPAGLPSVAGVDGCGGAAPLHDTFDCGCTATKPAQGAHLLQPDRPATVRDLPADVRQVDAGGGGDVWIRGRVDFILR